MSIWPFIVCVAIGVLYAGVAIWAWRRRRITVTVFFALWAVFCAVSAYFKWAWEL